MSTESSVRANPAPIGLIAFGMTTILLNIHNAGYFELNVMIMAMGIFYGGIAQLIAGCMEWHRGNTFGSTVFISYGSFWLSLVFIWVAPHAGLPAASPVAMGWYLSLWGIFTAFMACATWKGALIGRLVFSSLTLLFALLASANFTGSHAIHIAAGIVGITCGSFAFYEAVAIVINEKHGRKILPL